MAKNSNVEFKVEQLSVGVEYSGLLTDSGNAYLFDIATGQLSGLLSDQTIISLSAGQEHILLLSESGQVLSYGHGSRGQLGHGNLENVVDTNAVVVEALDGIRCKAVAAGGWHSMALTEAGDVYVWGWNESGQLGMFLSSSPLLHTLDRVKVMHALKSHHALPHVFLDLSKLFYFFTLGMSRDVKMKATPTLLDISEDDAFMIISAGSRHSMAVSENGM